MDFESFDPGALLGASYRLADGRRVRLRVAASTDTERIAALLFAAGERAPALEARRLTRFHPRRRLVMCATTLLDGSDGLVGVGAVWLDGPSALVPDVLVTDEAAAPGVSELLAGALAGRARVLAHHRAA